MAFDLTGAERVATDKMFSEATIIDGLGGDLVPTSLSQKTGGITAFNATVASPHAGFRATIDAFYTYMTLVEGLEGVARQVLVTDDILRAKQEGGLGVIFGLQDGSGLEGNLPLLTILHRLGLRVMTLTYNERNALGDGCLEPHDIGITNFGMQVVRDMGRLGIVLDLSHSSEKTTFDAMKYASKPPVFSHSNPKALTPSPRCITDEQMRAVAELDGLVGISVYSPMTYTQTGIQPELADFLDRIDYTVNLIGIDHVGIGSDIFEGKAGIMWRATTKRRYPEMVGAFDRENIRVKGYEEHTELINVAYGLRARGYSLDDISKILGGNWLRIFRANWG